jgi:Putative peptidoglycan binding domain
MLLCQTTLETFEFQIGHVSEIDVVIGQTVKKGDIIGKEGNHGPVFSGLTPITLAMQKAGDHRGSHRHLQKRPVYKVRTTSVDKEYLQPHGGPYRSADGFYFEYVSPKNGYDSCVDWTLPLFNRDLFFGCSGYDVYLLQRALGLPADSQTGFFGPATLSAVKGFQTRAGINPTLGYVGSATRHYLNSMYSQI